MDWQPIATAPLGTPILVWLPVRDEEGALFPVWPAIITKADLGDGEHELIYDFPAFDEKSGIMYFINTTVPAFWTPLPSGPHADDDARL